MLRRTIVSVVLISGSLCAREVTQDHIQGALVGAALGDALARITTPLDTIYEIDYVYGHQGIASVDQYVEGDWSIKDSKVAPYASNTVLSLLTLDVLADARYRGGSKEQMADNIANGLVKALGGDYRKWDPLFDQRYYMTEVLQKAAQVAERKENSEGNPWWTDGGEDELSRDLLSQEIDSGALSRAWPVALVYADSRSTARYYTDYLTTITHRHATARAAASALVTGMIHALQGDNPEELVDQMVNAAEKFDRIERRQKRKSRKLWSRRHFKSELVAKDRMLSSDMIRYAARAANEGVSPEEFLGDTSKKKDSGRSYRGYLLGYNADEAVAAALYLFLRNPQDFRALVVEGSLAGGNAALITSLAGALYGAYNGLDSIKAQGYSHDLSMLEDYESIIARGTKVERSLRTPAVFIATSDAQRDFEESIEAYHHDVRFSSWFTARKLIILSLAAAGIATWYFWPQIEPYYQAYLEEKVTLVKDTVVDYATSAKDWVVTTYTNFRGEGA